MPETEEQIRSALNEVAEAANALRGSHSTDFMFALMVITLALKEQPGFDQAAFSACIEKGIRKCEGTDRLVACEILRTIQ